jgi:protein N-terminal glutamine amidohydrolase
MRGAELCYTAPVMSLARAGLEYQAFYCEENVWRLLAGTNLGGAVAWAVMVSNSSRNVVFLRQRSGRPVDGLVHWDYHVFAVAVDPIRGRVAIDMDSDLPLPCPHTLYLSDTFPDNAQSGVKPRFRILEAREYVTAFASDRSHMRKPDGSWLAPPPPWPAPGEGRPSLVLDWADMSRRTPGRVLDFKAMAAFAANRD